MLDIYHTMAKKTGTWGAWGSRKCAEKGDFSLERGVVQKSLDYLRAKNHSALHATLAKVHSSGLTYIFTFSDFIIDINSIMISFR